MRADVTIQPPTAGWPRQVGSRSELARQTRLALGLPGDRIVVMSGHQAQLWHAGIAAKAFAATQVAHAVGGVSAWVTVDQDATDPGAIAYPTADLHTAIWRLDPATGAAVRKSELAAVGTRPAERAFADVPANMHVQVQLGAQNVLKALQRHAGESTLATQFSAAAFEPLQGLAPIDTQCCATVLAGTAIFDAALSLMQHAPRLCAERYNSAIAGVPAARLRPLVVTDVRIELPLWRVRSNMPRTPVFAHDLATVPREQLAPRALLMTALLRAAACDVFIHGVGGGVYDQATDAWWHTWLADASHASAQSLRAMPLAPTAVVTATRRVQFAGVHVPTPQEIDAAVWRAHRTNHDVAVLGPAAVTRKQELLQALAQAPRRSATRRAMYRELHRLIAEAREQGAEAISKAKVDAQIALQSRTVAETAHARTWPCAFLPRAMLEELCYSVGRELQL